MTTPTCGTCKHWQDDAEYHNTSVKVRLCSRVKMWCDVTEWADILNGDFGLVLCKDHENDLAFTQDASDYRADLITRAEFGCVQWEASDDKP